MIGMWQILIILAILLIFFGPTRLEKIGPSLGKAIRGFKKGLDQDEENKIKEVSDSQCEDSESSEMNAEKKEKKDEKET